MNDKEQPLLPENKKQWGYLFIGFYLGVIINYLDMWYELVLWIKKFF